MISLVLGIISHVLPSKVLSGEIILLSTIFLASRLFVLGVRSILARDTPELIERLRQLIKYISCGKIS